MLDFTTVKQIALALPDTDEHPHFHLTALRVKTKIFATLWEKDNRVMLKLSPVSQSIYCKVDPKVFFPVPNKWGLQGCTFVQLESADKDIFQEALLEAYNENMPKKKKSK